MSGNVISQNYQSYTQNDANTVYISAVKTMEVKNQYHRTIQGEEQRINEGPLSEIMNSTYSGTQNGDSEFLTTGQRNRTHNGILNEVVNGSKTSTVYGDAQERLNGKKIISHNGKTEKNIIGDYVESSTGNYEADFNGDMNVRRQGNANMSIEGTEIIHVHQDRIRNIDGDSNLHVKQDSTRQIDGTDLHMSNTNTVFQTPEFMIDSSINQFTGITFLLGGLVLQSPNGSSWSIAVDNQGNITATPHCP